jgi:hypothetical protein
MTLDPGERLFAGVVLVVIGLMGLVQADRLWHDNRGYKDRLNVI